MNYKFSEHYPKFSIETSSEELIYFFSKNKYGIAFFFEEDSFVGWLSLSAFLNTDCQFKLESLKKDVIVDFFDYKLDHYKIASFFKQTNVRSALVINSGTPIGVFSLFNRYNTSFNTQKKQNALSKIQAYQDLLKNFFAFCGYKKIGILLDDADQIFLCDGIYRCSLKNVSQFDIVLDSLLFPELYDIYNLKNVIPLDQVLSCALLLELNNHANLMKSFFFVNEMNVDYDDLYEDERYQIELVNDIEEALKDEIYKEKAYEGFPEDLKYLQHLGTDVYHPVVLRYNGVFRYVKESKILGDFCNSRLIPSSRGNRRKALFFGPCIAYSLFTSKYSTIPEFLQQILNKNGIDIDLVNYGVPDGGNFLNDLIMMLYKNKASDSYCIFINRFDPFVLRFFKMLGIKYDYLENCMAKEHYWFFNENMHTTPKGNRIIAQTLFQKCHFKHISHNADLSYLRRQTLDDLFYLKENDVNAFKNYLRKNSFNKKGLKGYIGMNCSPFTKGHAYLIDYARNHCDYLYVFIVEDNPNAFPFYDRLCMVKEYCEKYSNVKVLSSSVFTCSKYTMSAYFNKNYEMNADMTEDVKNFAEIIIPSLDIGVRFFGSEENSLVTSKLNQAYEQYMPTIGKKCVVIPRLKVLGKTISATFIRERLRASDVDACIDYVPDHVLQYLRQLTPEETPNG